MNSFGMKDDIDSAYQMMCEGYNEPDYMHGTYDYNEDDVETEDGTPKYERPKMHVDLLRVKDHYAIDQRTLQYLLDKGYITTMGSGRELTQAGAQKLEMYERWEVEAYEEDGEEFYDDQDNDVTYEPEYDTTEERDADRG